MKKHIDIFIFVIFVIIIGSIILPANLTNLDELWNYNFANNIANGRLPYRDFNILQTPLLPIINAIVLSIFGNEVLIYRLTSVLFCSLIFFMEYKILRRLNINEYLSIIFSLILIYIFRNDMKADYNLAVLFITLSLIYIQLKKSDNNSKCKREILIGALAGTSILFKQTTGLFLTIITLFYNFLQVTSKEEAKKEIKKLMYRFIGACIPIILFIIYLTCTNTWNDFIDYTILGIKTFENSISYLELFSNEKLYIRVLAFLLPILLIIEYFKGVVKSNKSEDNKIHLVIFSYCVADLICMFPIADRNHFLIGSFVSIIAMCNLINGLFSNCLKGKIKIFLKYFIKYATAGILIFLVVTSLQKIYKYICEAKNFDDLAHYKYVTMTEGIKRQIQIVDKYIEESEKNVIILDATSCIYTIPLNQYNKNYDMFLKGNLGGRGEEGIIEDLKNLNNVNILIMNDNGNINWQNPSKVTNYVMNNFEKTGEVLCFNIYEK